MSKETTERHMTDSYQLDASTWSKGRNTLALAALISVIACVAGYLNDPVRGLELVRVEGFASGSSCPTDLTTYVPAANTLQRKISTTWDGTFRIPLSITEPNRSRS